MTNFPTTIDQLVNPNSSDSLNAPSHSGLHQAVNEAIVAIENTIGTTYTDNPDTLTFKVNQLQNAVGGLNNSTDAISELLGLEGNNDLTVYGIENPTNVDSFAKDAWRTVRYNLQVTKGSEVYTSELLASHDGTDIMISETNIMSNTDNNLFTYTFEENSGIISLRITPTSGEISVRYIRTAVKA
jgi:hypothetical protein